MLQQQACVQVLKKFNNTYLVSMDAGTYGTLFDKKIPVVRKLSPVEEKELMDASFDLDKTAYHSVDELFEAVMK